VDHSDDDEESAAVLEVVFDAPERAVTPGQAMVLYDGRAVQVDPGFARAWFPLVNPK
jgi:tRNA U34 2-thiouridine synthase MnmA/TrmU